MEKYIQGIISISEGWEIVLVLSSLSCSVLCVYFLIEKYDNDYK